MVTEPQQERILLATDLRINADGTGLIQLTHPRGEYVSDSSSVWSPDGAEDRVRPLLRRPTWCQEASAAHGRLCRRRRLHQPLGHGARLAARSRERCIYPRRGHNEAVRVQMVGDIYRPRLVAAVTVEMTAAR